jgi:hypothetical protein
MERRKLTFEESCSRSCAIKLTTCGGPTASGLEGYICENCALFLVTQFKSGFGRLTKSCSYCGNQPTIKTTSRYNVCHSCAVKALETTRWWYEHK